MLLCCVVRRKKDKGPNFVKGTRSILDPHLFLLFKCFSWLFVFVSFFLFFFVIKHRCLVLIIVTLCSSLTSYCYLFHLDVVCLIIMPKHGNHNLIILLLMCKHNHVFHMWNVKCFIIINMIIRLQLFMWLVIYNLKCSQWQLILSNRLVVNDFSST